MLIKDGGWWSAGTLTERKSEKECVCVKEREREVMKMKGLAGE